MLAAHSFAIRFAAGFASLQGLTAMFAVCALPGVLISRDPCMTIRYGTARLFWFVHAFRLQLCDLSCTNGHVHICIEI